MGLIHDLNNSGLTAADVRMAYDATGQLPITTGDGDLTYQHAGPRGGTVIDHAPRGYAVSDVRVGYVVDKGPPPQGSSASRDGAADYTDERYWVVSAAVNGGGSGNLWFQPDGEADDVWVTATHLPEWAPGGGTHKLKPGTLGLLVHLTDAGGGADVYVFLASVESAVEVKITGAPGSSDDPGEYLTAKILTGQATGMPPAGMTEGMDCVVENAAEAGFSNAAGKTVNPHWIPVGRAFPGLIVGVTTDSPPKPRVSVSAPNPAGFFAVALATDGGINGAVTTGVTDASYTYTVTDAGGNTLGTGMSPAWNRPRGILTGPATNGAGYYDGSGDFVLAFSDEQGAVVACATGGGG